MAKFRPKQVEKSRDSPFFNFMVDPCAREKLTD